MANFPYTLGLFTAPCSTVAGFMAIRLVVAVTDREWFDHLRTKLALSERTFGPRPELLSAHWNRASYFYSSCTRLITRSSVVACLLTLIRFHALWHGKHSGKPTARTASLKCVLVLLGTAESGRMIEATLL